MWIYDAATLAFLAVNEAALKQYGYSQDEFLQMTVKDIRPPEDLPAFLQRRSPHAGGLEKVGSWRHRKKDGSVFHAKITIHEIEWQGRQAKLALLADETEGRRTAAALSESEEQIRLLLDSTAEGIFGVDLKGMCTFCNRACLTMLGFSQSSDLLGKHMHDVCHHSRADGTVLRKHDSRIFKAFLQGEGAHASDEVFWRCDRTSFPTEYWSYPIRRNGQLTGYVVSFLDITERKQAEEALSGERILLRTLIDNMPDYIYVKDAASRFLVANYAVAQLMGAKIPENLLGRTDFEFFPKDLASAFFADEQAIMRSGQALVNQEEPSLDAGGNAKWTLTSKVPLRDSNGQVTGIVGIGRDITKRKHAEKDLEARTAYLNALIENNPLATVVLDSNYAVQMCNPAFARLFLYDRTEVVGRLLDDLVVPRDLLEEANRFTEQNLTGHAVHTTTRRARKDGKQVDVEIYGVPLVIDGQVKGSYGIYRDISEEKRLEQQLRQSQKMEAVGRLAGGVAHDFNNLLSVIIGYSELLEEALTPTEALRKKAEEIKKAGRRAASLTRQLLAFSRQQVLEPKILNLNAVVSDTEKMLQRLLGEDIEIAAKMDPALGRVKVDQGQLEQVIMNLVVNARDAMPQGGKLTIETSNVVQDEAYVEQHPGSKPGPYVVLTVSDNGIGMDAETQTHIFEPFFTTKELGRGTGLGLATVYGIVKQSEGFIWVSSELGRGTTFKIHLPRVERAGEQIAASPIPVPRVGGSETILVVEDADSLRELAQTLLEGAGYKVLEANGGAQALEIAQRTTGPIHLLLTDVIMPAMNGRILAEKLTSMRPEMKVLYVSGYTDYATVHRGVLEEDAVLLQKPYTRDSLLSKVREILDPANQKSDISQPGRESGVGKAAGN